MKSYNTTLAILFILSVFAIGFTIGGVFGINIDQKKSEDRIITSKNFNFIPLETSSTQELTENSEKIEKQAEISLKNLFGTPSPQDWIKEENIELRSNGVFIKLEDPKWARIADTKSMEPVLNKDSHAIQIEPKTPSDIKTGDIISYYSEEYGFTIIHRVISTNQDEQGWYAITKGDNNETQDPWKVRFKNIKKVLVAIIY